MWLVVRDAMGSWNIVDCSFAFFNFFEESCVILHIMMAFCSLMQIYKTRILAYYVFFKVSRQVYTTRPLNGKYFE